MDRPGASDVRHLRTFLVVAEAGSFTRAAALLHLTQQAVSSHVKRLEADLGVELLARTTRSVSLTEAGQRLASEAGDLLVHLDDLWRRTRADARVPRGVVRIGMSAAAAHEMAPDLVELVGRDHPRIEVVLSEMDPLDVFAGIHGGTLDLGMTLEPPGRHELGGIRLLSGTVAPLVARSLHPAGIRQFEVGDLRSMTLFIPNREKHPYFHECGVRFAAREHLSGTITAMATSTLPKSVFLGKAFALWPTVLPERFVPAGLTLVDFRDVEERVDLWLSFRPGRVDPAVDAVVATARRLISGERERRTTAEAKQPDRSWRQQPPSGVAESS